MSATLIERLQAATGPGRELDAAVWQAARGGEVWSYNDNSHIDFSISRGTWKGAREDHPDFDPGADANVTWRYHIGERGTLSSEYGEVPRLTASIDAALMLVPAGLLVTMTLGHGKAAVNVKTGSIINPETKEWSGYGTAPNAVCIAALKALAEMPIRPRELQSDG